MATRLPVLLAAAALLPACGPDRGPHAPLEGELWAREMELELLGFCEFLYFQELTAVGDLDADGWRDCVLTVRGQTRNALGVLTAYSGRDGEVLFALHGEAREAALETVVADPGDVDGDGHDDLAATFGRRIEVVSGRDGRRLPGAFDPGAEDRVAGLVPSADSDGDGVGELFVALVRGPRVVRVSGATRAVLDEVEVTWPDIPGSEPPRAAALVIADLGDLNGDGVGELGVAYRGAVLSPTRQEKRRERPPWLSVHCGRTLTPLALHGGDLYAGQRLHDVRAGCDVSGDGLPDPLLLFERELVAVSVTDGAVVGALDVRASRFQGASDFDGDGAADPVLYAELFAEGRPLPGGSEIVLVSGTELAPLGRVEGARLGLACSPGDLTGDGVPDLVVADGWLRLVSGAHLR